MNTRKFVRVLGRVAGITLAGGGLNPLALGSSHREAPFLTENPKVDATDFYMFNSYEADREGFVTLIANYLPLQDPYGGPNYFQLDPDARYEIHIDHNGDAREDVTFRFEFTHTLKNITVPVGGRNVSVPLINVGGIGPDANDTTALNVIESYSVHIVHGDQSNVPGEPITHAQTGAATFIKPVDNIGSKSFSDYEAYVADHVYPITIPGCDLPGRMFVGQRKDPFVVNLGEVFDLVNTMPVGPSNGESDTLADKNVTSFILEVAAICLTTHGDHGKGHGNSETVIGGWTTADLRSVRQLKFSPTFDEPAQEKGKFIQVSRLGMPLVNELVIGLKDKDRFNASEPRDDGQFLTYVTHPTLPVLLNALFGVTPPCLPRNDLVGAFLTGFPGLNRPAGVVPSEMLRLNTSVDLATGIPAKPKGMQNRLGVLGGDLAGFPNGRRPGDDVVDIALRAVMGAVFPDAGMPGGCAPNGNLPFTDGAFIDDSYFDGAFPYLLTPLPGSN